MEKGYESLATPHRPTIVGCIEDRIIGIQKTKESFLSGVPLEHRGQVGEFKEVRIFDTRLAYLNDTLQRLKSFEGMIGANTNAIRLLQTFLDQMDTRRSDLVAEYGSETLTEMDAIRTDIIEILEAYAQ